MAGRSPGQALGGEDDSRRTDEREAIGDGKRSAEIRAGEDFDPAGVETHQAAGGVEGAFGAGLLVGWTAAGTRPEFQVVTGVSAGAIIARFAFLGPEYDGALREIYSSFSSDDLVERRGVFAALEGDSVMETAPLRRLIDRYLGDEEVARIAAEGRKGRKLLVGTTNLTAARPMVWDLTKIAGSGAPNARQLIGDVILASSAIPGVFPPVRIGVESGGGRYDELHVDGGVTPYRLIAFQ